MAVFFAQPYDDETFSCCVSRYVRKMAVSEPAALIQRLTGTRSLPLSMVYRLKRAEEETFDCWGLSWKGIADRLTLAPFFTAFMSDSELTRFFDAIEKGANTGPPGVYAKSPSALRYCESCFADDRTACRDEYWRRSHQIPGVLFCHRHGTLLGHLPITKKTFSISQPSARWPSGEKPNLSLSESQVGHSVLLAQKSHDILTTPQRLSREKLLSDWREIALRAGFRQGRRIIDMPRLNISFREFYGDDLLRVSRELFEIHSAGDSVLPSLATLRYASPSTLVRWGVFFDELAKAAQENDWPHCPNEFAGHAPPRLADQARRHGKVWRAMCRCGYFFEYSHVVDGWPQNVKMLFGGPTVHREAQRLADGGMSIKDIAIRFGVSRPTVSRWLCGKIGSRGARSDMDIKLLERRLEQALKRHGTVANVIKAEPTMYSSVMRYARHLLRRKDVLG